MFLANKFLRIKKIAYSGGGYVAYKNNGTRAYGSKNFYFWTDVIEGLVNNIWITWYGEISAEQRANATHILICLGNTHELILVDWNINAVTDLTNANEIASYLKEFNHL